MSPPSQRPAVQAARPPRAPYRVVNAVVRWLLSTRRGSTGIGEQLLLLQVTGRRTGRLITVPVAYRPTGDGRLLVLTSAIWRVNLRGGQVPVGVTLRGVRASAAAELVEDPGLVAVVYRNLIGAMGSRRAGRRLGIRIAVDRVPTVEELADAARRDGLSLVYLTPVAS